MDKWWAMKAIRTKYHLPSEKRNSRITSYDGDGNRVIFECRADCSAEMNHCLAALKLIKKQGWLGKYHAGWLKPGEYVFVCVPVEQENAAFTCWFGSAEGYAQCRRPGSLVGKKLRVNIDAL